MLINYLGIAGKSSTKLFGNKAGISFKNKIDLLFDIDVLSKEEHGKLELIMIFRNKFLHDIHCNSFLSVLERLDSGITNKFKKYLNLGAKIENEKSCSDACFNLYGEIIKIILNKVIKKKTDIKDRSDTIKILLQKNRRIIDLSCNFAGDILKELENILKSPKLLNQGILVLSKNIGAKCTEFNDSLKKDKKMLKLDKKFAKLMEENKLNNFFK